MNHAELKKRLIANAIDFLNRAIDDFHTRPKYSIINFYSAVELILKARLFDEHWTLVVQGEPDFEKFVRGDFQSVNFQDSSKRLSQIIRSGLSDNAFKNFDAVRRHRNKIVHFFHEADFAEDLHKGVEIATEQLRAWHDLQKLVLSQWKEVFDEHKDQFNAIETKLTKYRDYLTARFDSLSAQIAKEKGAGQEFSECSSCGHASARLAEILPRLFESDCLVCGYRERYLLFDCRKCGNETALRPDEYECEHCGERMDEEELVDSVDQLAVTPDNYFDVQARIHCGECEGFETVVLYEGKYLCVNCFDVSEGYSQCEFCSAPSTADLEDSYLDGCSLCDGRMGWKADQD
jgi:hypothetical protein